MAKQDIEFINKPGKGDAGLLAILNALTSLLIIIVLVCSCSGIGNSSQSAGSNGNESEASPILIEFSDRGQNVNQTILYVNSDKFLYASAVRDQIALPLKDGAVILN